MNFPHPVRVLLLSLALLALTGCADTTAPKRHVVVVVMDGLRPDSITPEQMPTLAALAKEGTVFAAHHSVYPSSTQVNGIALATGQKPVTSGIVANREYRPDLELLRPIDTNEAHYVWRGDRADAAGWIHTPTLPELVRSRGLRTTVAGTKAVALLWDRSFEKRSAKAPTVYEGRAIPSAVLDGIIPTQGPFPPGLDWKFAVNTARDSWTARALTEQLWAAGVPDLTVLWLYEPDFSQHGTGVGSENAKRALQSSDQRLVSVLEALEQKGIRQQTDVIVVSDHGFSTISRKVDVPDALRKAGFKAEGEYRKPPEKGNILVTGLGGSVTFYVVGGEDAVRRKLVEFLQTTDWCGVIFTRDGLEGTFKYADVGLDAPGAPDVMVSMRWKEEISQHGTPGTVICDGMEKGQGMHVSLSPYDMRATLIAAGPDFKPNAVSKLPSGNSDVAPTIAHLLGIKPEKPMDGRILHEAFNSAPMTAEAPKATTMRTGRKLGEKTWKQYLTVTTFGGCGYVDEGNAEMIAPPATRPATTRAAAP